MAMPVYTYFSTHISIQCGGITLPYQQESLTWTNLGLAYRQDDDDGPVQQAGLSRSGDGPAADKHAR